MSSLTPSHFKQTCRSLLLKLLPQWQLEKELEFGFLFRSPKGELLQIHLERLYALCQQRASENLEELLAEYVHSLLSALEENLNLEDWQEMKKLLFPALLGEDQIEKMERQLQHIAEEDKPLGISFTPHTGVLFQLDLPTQRVFVSAKRKKQWGVELEELYHQALENLRNLKTPRLVSQEVEGQKLYLLTPQDDWNASRILLPEVHELLLQHIGEKVALGVPCRNMFLACSLEEEEAFVLLYGNIYRFYREDPYPASPRVFFLDKTGLKEGKRAE